MVKLGLSPQETAAAARVDKGTLYRILVGETRRPHRSTIRRLCKILQIDFVKLMGAEQLELLGNQLEETGMLSEIEELLVLEVLSFSGEGFERAFQLAVFALGEVKLGMGARISATCRDVLHSFRGADERTARQILLRQLRAIPRAERPAAVRNALGILIDLRIFRGSARQSPTYGPIHQLSSRLWKPTGAPKRKNAVLGGSPPSAEPEYRQLSE
jgi:transcriptional regulator with XRE-family HTH domain